MRIIITSPYPIFPINSGCAVRIINICKYLGEEGHEVVLFSPIKDSKANRQDRNIKNVKIVYFRAKKRLNHFFCLDLFLKLKEVIKETQLIILCYPYQGIMIYLLSKLYRVPFILDEHNIEFVRFKRLRKKILSKFLFCLESFLIKRAKDICVVSFQEQCMIKDYFNKEAILAPNGVDADKFHLAIGAKSLRKKWNLMKSFIVLFFGTLEYQPNKESIQLINDQIAPQVYAFNKDVKFLIVGRNPPILSYHEAIIITGPVKKIEDYINLADIVIVPLTAGGGTRLKIIEAMACEKLVISTRIGAEGLDVEDGKNIILIEINDFSSKILQLAKTGIPLEMKNLAREKALKYSWKNSLKALSDAIKDYTH